MVWRNIPVGVNQKIPYQSEETQWGDCSEETYIIYPDGTCVRRMDLWTSTPDAWYEWCQSLQVLHPSQRPEDVLDASRIMSVAAMDGSSREFGWDFEGKARQDESSLQGANIQVTYLKSEWNPYLILEDGNGLNEKGESGPRIDRYAGRWSEFSDFPWRNHWPVAQDYVIGRYACAPDAPSHTYTATQYNAPHSLAPVISSDNPSVISSDNPSVISSGVEKSQTWKMTKLMLCGCTRGDAADLLPLAKSWLRAPRITCTGKEVPYDVTQRAYVLEFSPRGPSDLGRDDKGVVISSEVEKSHVFNVQASPEHPANGLCIILKGESETPSALKIDGKEFTDFKAGVKTEWDGPSLILWLPIESEKAFEIEI